jgi:hypothetical protein
VLLLTQIGLVTQMTSDLQGVLQFILANILRIFGEASGLKTNMAKSSVFPIHCAVEHLDTIRNLLPCAVDNFPCKYLGVPLSLKKLGKQHLQPFIDKIAHRLPCWKADLLTRAGRLIIVQTVLSSMTIYLMMAMDLPSWVFKAIDKIRRNFLWRGRKEAIGGHCLVAWNKVTRPKEFGGLGILNLYLMSWALRLRWLWLKKTDTGKPWASFKINDHPTVKAFFSAAVSSVVGNGKNTLFWTGKWIDGQSLSQLAPHLVKLVSSRAKMRNVHDALNSRNWVHDIRGAILLMFCLTSSRFGTSLQTGP